MQYAIAVAALVATVSASYEAYPVKNETAPIYATEVVTEYTTYCPYPTTLTHGSQTYTVVEPTTLVITDTITKPAVYPTGVAPTGAVPAPYPSANGTAPAPGPSAPAPAPPADTPDVTTPVATSAVPTAPIETGAASKAFAPAGLALLAAVAALF